MDYRSYGAKTLTEDHLSAWYFISECNLWDMDFVGFINRDWIILLAELKEHIKIR